ncbi:MAG: DUF429 domain-containing protein [Sporichthyaceae bacterium]
MARILPPEDRAATTVGIDLAASAKNTALSTITWDGAGARVDRVVVGVDDRTAIEAMNSPATVGIDCPFGWPRKFVELMASHAAGSTAPMPMPEGYKREYVLRETDRWIHREYGVTPLSVAADLIAHAAIRLAGLFTHLDVEVARDGSGRIAEVYPALAMRVWGLSFGGRKSSLGAVDTAVDHLLAAAPWLDLGAHEPAVRVSDHAFDAVLCALVARAVSLGLTAPPSDRNAARSEGWIHVPICSLRDLGGAS